MNKLKVVFWVLLIGFFGLLIYENQELFLSKNGLRIDLYFYAYQVPEITNAIYYLAYFLIGLLVSYFATLAERFKSNKTIKDLKSTSDSHLQKVSVLQAELDALKRPAVASTVQPQDSAS